MHVRAHPVDQGNATVAGVEDNAVLVLDGVGPDDAARAGLEGEAAVLVGEPVHSDPPG